VAKECWESFAPTGAHAFRTQGPPGVARGYDLPPLRGSGGNHKPVSAQR